MSSPNALTDTTNDLYKLSIYECEDKIPEEDTGERSVENISFEFVVEVTRRSSFDPIKIPYGKVTFVKSSLARAKELALLREVRRRAFLHITEEERERLNKDGSLDEIPEFRSPSPEIPKAPDN